MPSELASGAKFPELIDKRDSNNGLPAEWTRLTCLMSRWEKTNASYSYYTSSGTQFKKEGILPRIFWIKRDWSLQQLHLEVFKSLRFLISVWIDYKDPGNEKKRNLSKTLPEFPHRPKDWDHAKPFTRADFDSMDLKD